MPGAQSVTTNYDTIRTLTHPKVAKKVSDNITKKIPVLFYLDKVGHKEYEDGGMNYVLPVLKSLGTAQAYSGSQVLTSSEVDSATVAIYERKQITVPIVATGTKMLQNTGRGEESVVDYLTYIVEVAQETMKDAIGGDSIGIFSSLNESDAGVTGLATILGTNASTLLTTGVVGGISRVDNAFWRQQSYNLSATGFNTYGLVGLRTLFYACTRGDEAPGLVVLNQTTFANFDRTLTGTINYNTEQAPKTEIGQADFPILKYRGADVVFDSNCPSSTGYILNLKYFRLLVHRDRDMSIREWIAPIDQDAILARIFWAGNLVCTNLARQGLLYGAALETWG